LIARQQSILSPQKQEENSGFGAERAALLLCFKRFVFHAFSASFARSLDEEKMIGYKGSVGGKRVFGR
jgi:hypothetical protein